MYVYSEMLKRWVSAVQWEAGTMESAVAAVWRAAMGMVGVAVSVLGVFD